MPAIKRISLQILRRENYLGGIGQAISKAAIGMNINNSRAYPHKAATLN